MFFLLTDVLSSCHFVSVKKCVFYCFVSFHYCSTTFPSSSSAFDQYRTVRSRPSSSLCVLQSVSIFYSKVRLFKNLLNVFILSICGCCYYCHSTSKSFFSIYFFPFLFDYIPFFLFFSFTDTIPC